MLRFQKLGFLRKEGIGIGTDGTVPEFDDTGRILLCQFRVMGDHDHQTIRGNFLQKIHDLDAGVTVQSTGGLIRQKHVRIVDQCTGDGHTLHLSAGQLAGALVHVLLQPHLFQCFDSALTAIRFGDSADGEGQFHIGQNRLVRDQVVALKYKANGVVSIRVPVAVLVFFCGDSVDDKIPGVVAVQTADDIQQRGLSGTAGA